MRGISWREIAVGAVGLLIALFGWTATRSLNAVDGNISELKSALHEQWNVVTETKNIAVSTQNTTGQLSVKVDNLKERTDELSQRIQRIETSKPSGG